jgi:predicted GTPase
MADRVDSPHRELPALPDLTYVPTNTQKENVLIRLRRPDDIIIAVMGITGCGKSTFVNLFSDRRLEVGHGLDSCKSNH